MAIYKGDKKIADRLPDIDNTTNGKFLTNDGTDTSWESVDLSGKQDTLVSGTNIKTINSQSLLGSGDITISGTGANTDLSNLSTTGKSTASGFGLPSSTSVDLTLGASGSSYTAPANGWFIVILKATATTWANIYCNGFQYNASTNVYTNNFINCIVPAKKNHILSIHYGSAAKEKFYFIYAEGEQ